MSRQAGSIVRGFQCRAGYPSKRAGSRCRYLLWDEPKVKVASALSQPENPQQERKLF